MNRLVQTTCILLILGSLVANPVLVNAQSNPNVGNKTVKKSVIQGDDPVFESLSVQQLSLENMANPIAFSLVGIVLLSYFGASTGYYMTIGGT